MRSPEMRSRVVVHVVRFALLALLADAQAFLGLEGRLFWLHTDPHTLEKCVHVIPVALKLMGSSESDGAVWALERSLGFVVRWQAGDLLFWSGDGFGCWFEV